MTKKLIPIAAAAALVVPATAHAKEISKLEVCGASDCSSTSDRGLLAVLGEGSNGGTPGSTPALQPYYRLVYTVTAARGEHFENGRKSFSFTTYYVPGARETRGTDEQGNAVWLPASTVFVSALRKLAGGVDAYAAPRITRVTVGGQSVADPASYARLLTIRGADAGFVDTADWREVRFAAGRANPWSDEAIPMLFSPKTGVLARDGGYLKLPAAAADAIRAGKALPSPGTGGFPGWAFGLIGAALAAATALAVLLILRRPKPRRGRGPVAEAA